MSFSENLQYLRKRDRITQEELADKIGVSRQSVSKWETGEAYPETDKLIILCDMFDVSLDVMLRGNASAPAAEENSDKVSACEKQSICEKENEPNCKEQNDSSNKKLADAICGVIMLSATAIYIVLGIVWELWHPFWIIFPVCGIACVIISTVTRNKIKSTVKLCGVIMLSATAVYIVLGFVWELWHPAWIIFPVCGIACAIIKTVSGVKGK